MRTMIMTMALAMAACSVEGSGTTAQAVAGPSGVTVTVRAADQLAVSWTAVPTATKYYVFQSTGGGALAYAASVTGAPPATSYIATGLSAGVSYCFAISAVFHDGSESDLSAVSCAATSGGATPTPPTRSVRFFPHVIANDGSWSQSDGFGVPRLVSSGTSTTGLYLEIPYERGESLVAMTVDVKGAGSGVASFSVTSEVYNTPITGSSVLALVTDSGRSGAAWSTLALTPFTARALTGDRFLYLAVTQNAAGYSVGTVEATFHRAP